MPKLTGTKKQKLLALYAQGYDVASPEVKKAASNYKTRQSAWKEWQDAGLPGRVGQTIAEAEPDTVTPIRRLQESSQISEADIGESASKDKGTVIPKDQAEKPKVEGEGIAKQTKGLGFTSPVPPRMLKIGQFLIPEANWGFSDEYNMLLVAATYSRVVKPKSEGGMDYGGYVGDFCADCVRLFRRIFDFEYLREEGPMEVEHAESGREMALAQPEGEGVERGEKESES